MVTKMEKKKITIITIVVFVVGLIIAGSSYAFWSWTSNVNKNVVFNIASNLRNYIVYNEGESAFTGELNVSNSYLTGSIHSTISIYKTTNVNMLATIHMDVNQIGPNMKNSTALKWVVTAGTVSNVGAELAHGNFVGANNVDTLTLVPDIPVNITETFYTIWIWLDSSENPSDNLSGETLDTNVWTEINQAEGAEDRYEITNTNANYQQISATVVDSKYKVTHYAITTTNSDPSNWTEIIPTTEQNNVYTLNESVSGTGTYYIWFKDESNRVKSKIVTVSEIDTTKPSCNWGAFTPGTIKNNITSSVTLTCTDSESGIGVYNLQASDFVASNNKITVTSVTKESVTNGYQYTITVTGTTNDGTSYITLVADKVRNGVNLANTSTSSGNVTVENIVGVSDAVVTLEYTSTTYNGSAKTPSVTVTKNGVTLTLNTDYTVAYSNNTNVGTATVTITGIGNYVGETTRNFTIAYNSFNITLDNANATTNGTSTLYMRYADGVYLDSNYTNKMTTSTNPITIPVRTGYSFMGYYDNTTQLIDSTGKITSAFTNTKYSSAKTLNAQWSGNSYTVTANANGGTIPSTSGWTGTGTTTTKPVTYGNTYSTLPAPTRDGYDFVGWYTSDTDGTQVTSSTTVSTANNHTIYAHWTGKSYTVNFDDNRMNTYNKTTNGVTIEYTESSHQVKLNGTPIAAQYLQTTSHDFVEGDVYRITLTYISGSFTSTTRQILCLQLMQRGHGAMSPARQSCPNLPTSDNPTTTGSLTITANDAATAKELFNQVWAETPSEVTYNDYVVKVDVTKVESKTVTYAGTYGTLPSPTRIGYTFNGWYTAESGGTQVTSSSTVSITANQTLYAHWTKNSYSISYVMNGGTNNSNNPTTATYDTPLGIANPSKSITVTGNANGTGCTIGSATTTSQPFAGWTSNVNTDTAKYGTASTQIYHQWSDPTTALNEKYFNDLTPTNNGSVTMTAHWTTNAVTCPTATLAGNTCAFYSSSGTSGGSKVCDSGGTYTPGEGDSSTKTIYARCTPNSYTVTANAGAGSISSTSGWTGTGTTATKSVTYGGTYGTLPSATRTGHTLVGWFDHTISDKTVAAGTGNYNGVYVLKVTPGVTYTVNIGTASVTSGSATYFTAYIYDKTGTTGWNNTNVPFGNNVSFQITCPSSADASHDIWLLFYSGPRGATSGIATSFTNIRYGTNTSGDAYTSTKTVSATSNHTIYAIWSANSYTLTANAGAGSISSTSGWTGTGTTATKTVTYAGTYGALPTPTRTGHTLVGWFNHIIADKALASRTDTQYNYTTLLTGLTPGITYTINIGSVTVTSGSATKFTSTIYDSTAGSTIARIDHPIGNNVSYQLTVPSGTNASHSLQLLVYAGVVGSTSGVAMQYTNIRYGTSASGDAFTSSRTVATASNHTIYAVWAPLTRTITYDDNRFNTYNSGEEISGVTVSYAASTHQLTLTGTQAGNVYLQHPTHTFVEGEVYRITLTYVSGTITSSVRQLLCLQLMQKGNASMPSIRQTCPSLPTSSNQVTTGTLTISADDASTASVLFDYIWTSESGAVTYNNYVVKVDITKVDSKTVTYANTYDTLPSPTRIGYTFNGWYTAESGGTQVTSSTIVSTTDNHTLYAHWTKNSHSISYTLNGGTHGTTHPSSRNYDTLLPLSNPTKTVTVTGNANGTGASVGSATSATQTFAGWTSNANTNTARYGTYRYYVANAWNDTTTKLNNNYYMDLTPTNNGSVTMTANWTPVAVTLPTLSLTGNTCNYYTTSGTSGGSLMGVGGASWTPSATSAAAVTAYARCSANSYTVTANAGAGSISSTTGWTGTGTTATKSVTYGGTYGTLPTVSRTGHSLAGWFNHIIADKTLASRTDTQYNNTTLLTGLTPGITYTINIGTVTVTSGSATKFTSIIYDSTAGSTLARIDYPIGNNVSYQLTVPSGTDASHSLKLLVYAGVAGSTSGVAMQYTNIRYGTSASGDAFTSSRTVATASNHTIYAVWAPLTRTITYNANGGNDAPSATTYVYQPQGTTNLSSTIPTRTGYTFLGWSTSNTATSASYSAGQAWNLSNASNYTLYAVWRANVMTVYLRPNGATTNTDGGSVSNPFTSYSIKYTDTVAYQWPADYTPPYGYKLVKIGATGTGYYHIGSTSSSSKIAQDLVTNQSGVSATSVANSLGVLNSFQSGDVTVNLYAGWATATYSISYNLNGGSHGTNHPTSATYGASPFAISAPSKSGYTFTGWTSTTLGTTAKACTGTATSTCANWGGEKTARGYYTNLSDSTTGVTLVANWVSNTTYTVKVFKCLMYTTTPTRTAHYQSYDSYSACNSACTGTCYSETGTAYTCVWYTNSCSSPYSLSGSTCVAYLSQEQSSQTGQTSCTPVTNYTTCNSSHVNETNTTCTEE